MELEVKTVDRKFSFKKAERLCEKKSIGQLFKTGRSFFYYPFKVVFLPLNEQADYPAKILISVPKRNFKKAVDRNRLKRLIREAYRKNKHLLYNEEKEQPLLYLISFIYTATQLLDYQTIEKKIILALQQISTEEK